MAEGKIEPLRLGIGIPAYGGKVSAELARAMLEVGHALAASEERFTLTLPVAIIDVCRIDKARCMLVDAAVLAGCDWLLQIDADVWAAEGYQLLRMISDAAYEGWRVVVGTVPRRNTDGTRELMIYDYDGRPINEESVRSERYDLFEIGEAATACMAINVPWATSKLDRPWFRFTPERSEDRDFCYRIRTAGGRVAADRRVQTRHLNRAQVLTWDGLVSG